MISGHDIAKYFLAQTDEDAGDLISNLKLQKLLYYAQGFNLALYDEPLFPESIEAWTHGPVVPEVYHEYKDFGSNAIPIPSNVDFSKYDQQTRELLDEVYSVYGQFSAWKLLSLIQFISIYSSSTNYLRLRNYGLRLIVFREKRLNKILFELLILKLKDRFKLIKLI
jgi:uncharacterized phage-associated protein